MLTPERTRTLLPQMMAAAGDLPWEFHGHCNNGLGPLNAIEAVKAGVRYVHTAVPPLANANSQPSVYNVAANLRELGYEVDVDEEVLRPATEHFTAIAEREGFQIGVPYEYDAAPVPAPGARRDDLEPAVPAEAGRGRRPAARGAGGDRARPGRLRLPDHGHPAVPVRRLAGRDQRDRRQAVRAGHRQDHRVRARPARRRRGGRRDGPGRPAADPRPPARPRDRGLRAAPADAGRSAGEVRPGHPGRGPDPHEHRRGRRRRGGRQRARPTTADAGRHPAAGTAPAARRTGPAHVRVAVPARTSP